MPQYTRVAANQEAPRTIEQFRPLLVKLSFKFLKRANGLGSSISQEDIEQELSLVFLRCVKSYDESKGASFMNFFITACHWEMNRIFRRDQVNMEYAGRTIQADSWGEDDEDSRGSLLEMVSSGEATPEEELVAEQCLAQFTEGLSEPTRLMVGILLDPPKEITRQFLLQMNGAQAIRTKLDGNVRASGDLNLQFLFRLFSLNRKVCKDITDEIRERAELAFCLQRA